MAAHPEVGPMSYDFLFRRLENSPHRKKWVRYIKVAAILFLILAATAPWIYRESVIHLTVERAKAAAKEGERQQALHWLNATFYRYPHATRLLKPMADFLEILGIPRAIAFREKLVEKNPADRELLQDYAATLLTFQQGAQAQHVLEQMESANDLSARHHHLKGTLLFQRQQFAEAMEEFSRAHELEPEQKRHRMNQLLCQLLLDDLAAESADTGLRAFEEDGTYAEAVAAARVLRALKTERPFSLVEASFEKLRIDMNQASPHYRIYLLGLLRWKPEALGPELASLWQSRPRFGLAATEHLRWLIFEGGEPQVAEALSQLESKTIQSKELVLLEAELSVSRQWDSRLSEVLEKEGWETMPTLKAVFRLWERRTRPEMRAIALNLILKNGRRDPQALLFAATYLSRWGMREEAMPVWQALALSEHPAWELGWSLVGRQLHEAGDREKELKFYRQLAKAHPGHPRVLQHLAEVEKLRKL
jgi:tetratricopeptide (TPR) repeat protein